MKKSFLAIVLILTIGSVNAENLFQSNNPFPQTSPQTMNNIYETEPAVIIKEQKSLKNSRLRDRTSKEQSELDNMPKIPVYPVYHEGAQSNGDYYMFTTGN